MPGGIEHSDPRRALWCVASRANHRRARAEGPRRLRARLLREKKDTSSHKFWDTQPVARDALQDDVSKQLEAATIKDEKKTTGYIKEQTVEEIRKEPYPLPAGFEWCVLDVNNEEQVREVLL